MEKTKSELAQELYMKACTLAELAKEYQASINEEAADFVAIRITTEANTWTLYKKEKQEMLFWGRESDMIKYIAKRNIKNIYYRTPLTIITNSINN